MRVTKLALSLIVAAVFVVHHASGQRVWCPNLDPGYSPGWICYKCNGSLYVVNPDTLSWDDHMMVAESNGFILASPMDSTANDCIYEAADKAGLMGAHNVWLGGTDVAGEGVWRWAYNTGSIPFYGHSGPSCEPGMYCNWGASAPDNGWVYGEEDCLQMLTENSSNEWNDNSCTVQKPAVYQKLVTDVPRPAGYPPTWTCYECGGVIYVANPSQDEWDNHKTAAEAKGLILAEPRSVEKEFCIAAVARAASTGDWVCIGASDAVAEGTWRWLSDGKEFYSAGQCSTGAYCNWEVGMPDNSGGAENAALIYLPYNGWGDVPSTHMASGVYEVTMAEARRLLLRCFSFSN
mmetsp:Transcript_8337/g.18009  ORF Transcript_8337/g.18009 Transcript_8337/m.18009 type:complete len:348 (-) Transcript_8337:181-1224(-)|eukprot:CAMPEP_0178503500 /NCGR_PEP_ID=MMETSP0696-20121128/18077_1 /TAXON_ID=265572 /ORGANISM="Extubocellulus spinifer, Strain CCMP396" /LENGTH=347 /DNA_ID=CAMNT_0020132641 /DNA_START=332 /DNA_END=1375 /DNA_ORIENTATION=+